MGLLDFFIGSFSDRELKKISGQVDAVVQLEGAMEALTDGELRGKTGEFKERLARGESLDDLLPEAFAVVREAAWRVLKQKPFPVQLLGGVALHHGQIAEMRTGEGKTLAATMPAYLNALSGQGVHVVTVNDYLAERDAEWMGKVYEFLGLKVGCVIYGLTTEERQAAYRADITYGTNNQFGFDYLRDNMAIYKSDVVQRGLHYAIVDEVDSILIDEARTPLIISGQGDPSTDMYRRANKFIHSLKGRILDPDEEPSRMEELLEERELEKVDYVVDEKRKTSNLTEQGNAKAEKYFGVDNIADPSHMELNHYIQQALRANTNMKRDIDYIVQNGEVKIVDEFTGRIMEGRRYSNGLHQAIEAKEGVTIKSESKTLATITFQNYFRMYEKLAGMTGTAMTEKDEFAEIYNLDVVEIPTNKPMVRKDDNDQVYTRERGKYRAIVEEIGRVHASGQPILVGTADVETSEKLSRLLKKAGIDHQVLNAKQSEKEASIVAQAGRLGSVTIATNMAGRGTDIVLGGNPEWMAKADMRRAGWSDSLIDWADSFRQVKAEDRFPPPREKKGEKEEYLTGREILEARKRFQELVRHYAEETQENGEKVREAGGLYILGTQRHESRRVDNQLRGRSGRQGDPGFSRFYISLEDNLMRLFGGEMMQKFVNSDRYPEDEPLSAGMLTKQIERAQRQVEANNFAIRKRVLAYDNVMNVQRHTIYEERNRVLDGENMAEYISDMVQDLLDSAVDSFCAEGVSAGEWEVGGLLNYLSSLFLPQGALAEEELRSLSREGLKERIRQEARSLYQAKEEEIGSENMRELERVILLQVVDQHWMNQIDTMDQLRNEISVRAFGNEDPVRAYENEGYQLFEDMNKAIQEDTVRLLYHIHPIEEEGQPLERRRPRGMTEGKASLSSPYARQPKGQEVPPQGGPEETGMNRAQRRAAKKAGRKKR